MNKILEKVFNEETNRMVSEIKKGIENSNLTDEQIIKRIYEIGAVAGSAIAILDMIFILTKVGVGIAVISKIVKIIKGIKCFVKNSGRR